MVDQRLIQKTEVGSSALQDILEWNDAEHARSQGLIGNRLVQQFMDIHMPKAVASSWSDVPGAIASLAQRIHLQEGYPKNPPRFLAIIDFNTPNSRDSLKVAEIASCTANIFKNFGVDREGPDAGRVQLTPAGPHAPSAARDHRVHPNGRRLACRQSPVLPVT